MSQDRITAEFCRLFHIEDWQCSEQLAYPLSQSKIKCSQRSIFRFLDIRSDCQGVGILSEIFMPDDSSLGSLDSGRVNRTTI
jgi:hypothetical protein